MLSIDDFCTGRPAVDRALLIGYFRRNSDTEQAETARTAEQWEALLAAERRRPTP